MDMKQITEHPLYQFEYCPRCGAKAFTVRNEKAKQCEACGFVYYFNPSAAVACFIRNAHGELLLVRRKKDPAKGTLDLPGGFVDMFETAEEAVRREVREETGLQVVRSRYLFSISNLYPYSGFLVHTMDMFFLCRVKDDAVVEAMDDVADSFWMPLDEIRPEEFGLDSVRKGVERFINEYNK